MNDLSNLENLNRMQVIALVDCLQRALDSALQYVPSRESGNILHQLITEGLDIQAQFDLARPAAIIADMTADPTTPDSEQVH